MSDEDTKFWIYAGGLPYELTEGDIVCVFSQYGEIFEISLSRDKDTGKSRGFCFIKYEDPRSCELAVDNFNGTTIIGRRIKVSFANNTNAVKSRKPSIVAPQQPETSTKPWQRDCIDERQHSPRSEVRVGDHKKRRYRHESGDSNEEIEKKYKPADINRDSEERVRHRDSRHNHRLDDSDHRNRHSDSNDRYRRRESPDRHRHRDLRDTNQHRDSRDTDRHRDSPERDRRRDVRHYYDHRRKRLASEDKNRNHDLDRKHRHRESEDKHRHGESDHKHRHSRHRSSGDRKSHN